MFKAFKEYSFRYRKELKIVEINRIVNRYKAKGYQLTLRQLYYQLVAAGVVKNTVKEYENVIYLVNRARLAGRIDWMAITDRSRLLNGQEHYTDPRQALESLAYSYSIDKWKTQENYVEVWIEKDALLDVVGEVARELDVNYMSSKGYFSASSLFEASMRFKAQAQLGKTSYVLYLGDHDPSGLDMSRDCEDRLELFEADVQFKRIGLSKDQIETYQVPSSPAKLSDARAKKYIEAHGKLSYEIDALGPDIIQSIIRSNVLNLRDNEKYQKRVDKELRGKQLLVGGLPK